MKNVWLQNKRIEVEQIQMPTEHAQRYSQYLTGYVNGVYTLPAFYKNRNCIEATVRPINNELSEITITWELNVATVR